MSKLPAELITPAEAAAISLKGGKVESLYRAKAILDAFITAATQKGYSEETAMLFSLATLYDAGRIQGIREQRRK